MHFSSKLRRISIVSLFSTFILSGLFFSTSVPGVAAGVPAQINVAPVAVVGDKSATITWKAPLDNGSAITSYTATSNPGNLTCTSSSLSCQISNLSNEIQYTFTVVATNQVGSSIPSVISNSVLPTHVPLETAIVRSQIAGIHKMAMDPSGEYAYIITRETGRSRLLKYEITSGVIRETIVFGTSEVASQIIYDSANSLIFVSVGINTGTSTPGNYLYKFDAQDFSLISSSTASGTFEALALTPDGTYLVGVGNLGGSCGAYRSKLSKIRISDLVVVAETSAIYGSSAKSIHIKNNNAYFYTSYTACGTFSYTYERLGIVSLSPTSANPSVLPGGSGSATFQGSGFPIATTVNSQGNLIAIMSDGTLVKTNLSNSTTSLIMSVSYFYGVGTFSADGRFAYVPGYLNGPTPPRIYKVDTITQKIIGFQEIGSSGFWPVASATTIDGSYMYLASSDAFGQISKIFLKDVPSSPLNVSGAFSDKAVEVTWQTPNRSGISSVISFKVVATPGGRECVTTSNSCVVSGLNNGVDYTFRVYPSNSEGAGIPSDQSAIFVPATEPSEPSSVQVVRGPRQATVSWTASTDNGGAAISYVATAIGTGQNCTSTGTSCVVTGLTNGVAYKFRVTANNKAGSSASVLSDETTPISVPDSPVNPIAEYGNSKATISWAAPQDTGGIDLSGFEVKSVPEITGGGTCEVAASATSCEISGLTNGVSYTFRIFARNSLGLSSASTTASVIPKTKPGMPSITSLVPGNGTVQITWSAPTSNGGAIITRYTVQTIDHSSECSSISGAILTCSIIGLANGSPYTFTVKATNSEGDSVWSVPSGQVIPRTIPGAPESVSSVFGNASATISWLAPIDNGGSPVTSYQVFNASTNGMVCSSAEPNRSCSVTGLMNGSSYQFFVKAINAAGTSSSFTYSPVVVPATTPGAPGVPTVSAVGNGQISLYWTITTVLGGSPITGHTVTATPPTGDIKVVEVPVGTNTTNISGLTPGVSYSFTVRTKNKAGLSASSVARTFTPQNAPGAPTNILVFPGDRSVTVRWTPPSDNGGAAITSYEVRNAVTGALVCTSSYPVGTSCTTGLSLVNGTSYSFKVYAVNGTPSLFTSVASATSTPVTPRGLPTAPTLSGATAGNGAATVSWNFTETLTTNRGSTITSYIVYARNLQGATLGTCETSSPAQRSCTVMGLTNGNNYRFQVAAGNDAGFGALSALSSFVTPDLAPNAPTLTSVIYGDQQVSVSWQLTQNSGSSNSQVSVTSSPGGKYCTVVASENSCIVTGLTNGTSYTFTVKVRNVSLESQASASSEPVTPRAKPTAPVIQSVIPGNGAVNIRWTLINNSGLAISEYRAVASPGGNFCVTNTLSCEISGLTNGTNYSFSVVASNSEGEGPSSSVSSSTYPRTVPSVPEFTSSDYGNGRISVEWSEPTSDGGSSITGYVITATSNAGVKTFNASSSARELILNSLTNGVAYNLTIRALNIAGSSLESTNVISETPWAAPSAPTQISVASRDGGVRVSWVHPANTDPSTTTYLATAYPGGQSCEVRATTNCIVHGLTNGASYVFSVVATNNSGSSSVSIRSIAVIPAAVPDSPTDVFAEVGQLSALVYWIAPIDNGGASISKYTVTASGTTKTCVTVATFCRVSGLEQGSRYRFTVRATNSTGEGDPSLESDELLIGQVPEAPNSVFGIPGPSQVTVSWGEPASGGAAITSYLVTSTPGGFICKSNGLLSCTIGGLANNVSYTFTVKATNEIGSSDNSIASAPVVPKNIPGQPSDISTYFQNPTTLLVAWTPVVNLENPVTKYQVDLLEPNYPFDVIQTIEVDESALSASLNGLTPGAAYRVQVTALSLTEEELGVVSLSAQNSALPAMLRTGSISGLPSRGSVLILNAGDWVGNPLPAISRAWYRCNQISSDLEEYLPAGCVPISGATSLTYTPTGTDVGKNVLAAIKVTNSAGYVLVFTPSTSAVKAPPSISKPQSVAGTASVGSTLTSTVGTWVGSPTPVLSIQWQRCTTKLPAATLASSACQNIDGATAETYVPVGGDVGKFIRSAVVGTNDGGAVVSYSASTATAVLQRPVLLSTPIVSGVSITTWTLTSSNGAWSASPLPIFTRTWLRCSEAVPAATIAHSSCVIISGATAITYKPVALDIGKHIVVAVKAKNSGGESISFSEATLAVRALPVSTVLPKVSGSFVVGNTVGTTSGTWTGFPIPTTVISWQRCTSSLSAGNKTATNCTTINNANEADYRLTNEDAGKYLRSIVTGTNDGATTQALSGTSTQVYKRPTLVEDPSILGPVGFKIKATLTATNGAWSGVPNLTYRQQWYRCSGVKLSADSVQDGCVAIPGATRATYIPVLADLGTYLVVSVEAKNAVSGVVRYSPTTTRITQ